MPGIFGFFSPRRCPPDGVEFRMARTLAYGPACEIDIARSDCGFIGVTYRKSHPPNGQILRSVDGSRKVCLAGRVVAVSGEEDGGSSVDAVASGMCERLDVELLSRMVGSFAAAVMDTRAGTVDLITDRQGMFPIYYVRVGDAVIYASEIKTLLASGQLQPQLDPLAVSQMLQIGFVCGELTPLRGVRVIPAGSVLRVKADGVAVDRYFVRHFCPSTSCDWDQEVDRLGEMLTQAVRRTCSSPLRTGVPVSGGLDSRALLALMPNPSNVPSFTFGTNGCRDLRFGARVARVLGSPHHSLPVDPGYLDQHIDLGVWRTEGQLGASHFHILPHVPTFARHCDSMLFGIG